MPPAPKDTCPQDREPWLVCSKTNPKATSASLATAFAGWGFVGIGIYGLLVLFGNWSADFWPLKSLFMALFFGSIGWLMEWQLDDSDDDTKPLQC